MDYAIRSGDMWDAAFAVRSEGDKLLLDGYPIVFNRPSRLMSIRQVESPEGIRQAAKLGARAFREIVHPGAVTKALSENPDMSLFVQHNMGTLPLGRTTAGTLRLGPDEIGVRALGDLPDNEWGRPVRDAVNRKDITGMSFRFQAIIEKWGRETLDDGYTGAVRHVHELRLGPEISLVTTPAYVETSAAIRDLADEADVDPDLLVEAFGQLKPEARLTPEQREALITVISKHSDAPVIDATAVQKMAQMRERLAALAG